MTVALTAAAIAQSKPAVDHSKMHHGAAAPATAGAAPVATPAGESPSTKAFKAANDRMHADMAIAYTGDADQDFVKGMLPHHQGAVDMAKVVLQYGKDPKVRKLAKDVIKAQQAEIAFMKTWQKSKTK
jgi:uncharacterized protein (DUF305 family)